MITHIGANQDTSSGAIMISQSIVESMQNYEG